MTDTALSNEIERAIQTYRIPPIDGHSVSTWYYGGVGHTCECGGRSGGYVDAVECPGILRARARDAAKEILLRDPEATVCVLGLPSDWENSYDDLEQAFAIPWVQCPEHGTGHREDHVCAACDRQERYSDIIASGHLPADASDEVNLGGG